ASPSLTTLRRIAAALEVPMAALFLGADEPSVGETDLTGKRLVVREGERRRLTAQDSGVAFSLLTPNVDRRIEFMMAVFAAKTSAPPDRGVFSSHPGEENALCISGKIVYVIEGQDFPLAEGDSISFESSRYHRTENRTAEPACLILAMSPPIMM